MPKSFALFGDVAPTLTRLKEMGLSTGVLSNLAEPLPPIVASLGIDSHLDVLVTSLEVGAEKPDPRMFQAALNKVGISPNEAVHVGDQYHSDVGGAKAVGIHAVLLDRGNWRPDITDCPRIANLTDLVDHLKNNAFA